MAEVRRHPWLLFVESAFLIVVVLLPPFIYFFVSNAASFASESSFYLFIFLYSFILLFVLIAFMTIFTNFYLDVLLVTNERIIDVEQKRFFSRELATVALENIQDITVKVNGLLANFFGYGDLYIQTAAESREFILKGIPDPEKFKKIIYDLHQAEVNEPKPVKIVP